MSGYFDIDVKEKFNTLDRISKIKKLPCCSVDKIETMPNGVAGVYFIFSFRGELIYIGCSKNIRTRVLHHDHFKDISSLKNFFPLRVYYYSLPATLNALNLEFQLIGFYRPKLNLVGNLNRNVRLKLNGRGK